VRNAAASKDHTGKLVTPTDVAFAVIPTASRLDVRTTIREAFSFRCRGWAKSDIRLGSDNAFDQSTTPGSRHCDA
jgi:hypothetical protein